MGGPNLEIVGPRRVGGPKFRSFSSLFRHRFALFVSLWGVFSWNFGGVLKRLGLKCARLEFSGCCVKPRRLQRPGGAAEGGPAEGGPAEGGPAEGGPAESQTHNNNNNNTIWGGSVLTGEEPPPHSGELKACSHPSSRPNPIPANPPNVVRTPHLHGAPTTEETVKL